MDIERSSALGRWLDWVRDSLPNRCTLCQQSLRCGRGLCDVCIDDFRPGPLCLGCTRPLPPTETDLSPGEDKLPPSIMPLRCGTCLGRKRWRPVVCATHYDNPVGRLAAAIKIRQQLSVIEPLCELLAERLQVLWQFDLIPYPDALIPVPMHSSKLPSRGFNHSLLIARELGKRLDIPVQEQLVVKIRATQDQHNLSGGARRRNLKHCFRVMPSPRRYNLALVDDIITTGTTMATLAARLRQAGHRPSQYWALASAMTR